MARIDLPAEQSGIQAAMTFRPETADALNDLVDVLLRQPHTMSQGERQLIGTYVAYANGCEYAHRIHGATAAADLGNNPQLVEDVRQDFRSADISPKLKALLVIAEQIVESGKSVTDEAVAAARAEGATDLELHDTMLIASAFCMYSRYLDALQVHTPSDQEYYRVLGEWLSDVGYSHGGEELKKSSERNETVGPAGVGAFR
jgi:uncharacterized peroxidase-related enzyme